MKVSRLNIVDFWMILGLYFLTISPMIFKFTEWGAKNYNVIVFFVGFIPIFFTHSSPIGLRFKNVLFSASWIFMILINGLLFNDIIKTWISMSVSFGFYHILRYVFLIINKEEPIPLLLWLSTSLEFNKSEQRMENKKDALFTAISFFCGLFLSTLILVITKK
jgi:hypothetical protein